MGASALSGAIGEGEAARMQGQFQRDQSYLNAKLSDQQAEDAIERGRQESNVSRRKTNAQAASQKVAAAAMGLDISEGSPAEAIEQTRAVGAVEEMNIRTNAWREAWGYRVQSANQRMEGDMAKIAGDGKRTQTLIAGGMQAISYGAAGIQAGRGPRTTTTPSSGGVSTSMTPYGNQPRIQPVR